VTTAAAPYFYIEQKNPVLGRACDCDAGAVWSNGYIFGASELGKGIPYPAGGTESKCQTRNLLCFPGATMYSGLFVTINNTRPSDAVEGSFRVPGSAKIMCSTLRSLAAKASARHVGLAPMTTGGCGHFPPIRNPAFTGVGKQSVTFDILEVPAALYRTGPRRARGADPD